VIKQLRTMKMKHSTSKYASLVRLLSAALLILPFASVDAADDSATGKGDADKSATVAYVDSVQKWGAWELDIEPAAGGLQASATRPLNVRNAKISLRTNSMAALAPPKGASKPPGGTSPPVIPPPVTPPPSITPPLPAAPTTPAPPGSTPPTVVTLP
jgi:hypothetical protein